LTAFLLESFGTIRASVTSKPPCSWLLATNFERGCVVFSRISTTVRAPSSADSVDGRRDLGCCRDGLTIASMMVSEVTIWHPSLMT
jgi:hypothetical protein